jgi:hypothetical protein
MSDDPASANAFRWELEQEIERLRAERDEARATYCRLLEAYKRGDGRQEAKKRGWDCFKENTDV